MSVKELIRNARSVYTDKTELLHYIHSLLTLQHGHFLSEYPEQVMAVTYISPNSKVLELGSNIGINSIIISSILEDDKNLVTLECDKKHIPFLTENRDSNGYSFHIESSALSKSRLLIRGWHTFPWEGTTIPPDCSWVDTISFDELQTKYAIQFDTIVADCEGALYYIIKESPEIIKNIKLLLVENDYIHKFQKDYVETFLISESFTKVYSLAGGFENSPCYDSFYEVWRRV